MKKIVSLLLIAACSNTSAMGVRRVMCLPNEENTSSPVYTKLSEQSMLTELTDLQTLEQITSIIGEILAMGGLTDFSKHNDAEKKLQHIVHSENYDNLKRSLSSFPSLYADVERVCLEIPTNPFFKQLREAAIKDGLASGLYAIELYLQVLDMARAQRDVFHPDQGKITLLHKAAWNGCLNIVRLLLKQPDIKIDEIDEGGNTALHKAVNRGYVAIVQVLLSAGANANIKNKFGMTPRTLINWSPNKEALQEIFEAY